MDIPDDQDATTSSACMKHASIMLCTIEVSLFQVHISPRHYQRSGIRMRLSSTGTWAALLPLKNGVQRQADNDTLSSCVRSMY